MPVDRAGMLEAPVDGNPPRPPRFEAYFFRPRSVPPIIENIEILAGENVPIAFEKRAAQMLGQRFEGTAAPPPVGGKRISFHSGPNKSLFPTAAPHLTPTTPP